MRNILLIFGVLCGILLQAQEVKQIDWRFLQDVKFEEKYYKEAEGWFLFPKFGKSVKEINGKRVQIKGYVIPLDVDAGIYALSAYPFAACFFCGGAGPETVISLKLQKGHRRYKTDDIVTFTGIFALNDKDINDFNYILKEAKEVR